MATNSPVFHLGLGHMSVFRQVPVITHPNAAARDSLPSLNCESVRSNSTGEKHENIAMRPGFSFMARFACKYAFVVSMLSCPSHNAMTAMSTQTEARPSQCCGERHVAKRAFSSAALRECQEMPLIVLAAPSHGTSPSGPARFSAKAESIDLSDLSYATEHSFCCRRYQMQKP